LSPEGYEKAIEYFNQAIEIEPDFALAFAGLADSYAWLSELSDFPQQVGMLKAKEFANHALYLDPNLAEAHTALGFVLMDYEFDFAGAITHYQKAIKFNPNYATARVLYGHLLQQLGDEEKGESEIQQAKRLDPLSVLVNWFLGFSKYEARRFDDALGQLEKTIELDPQNSFTYFVVSMVHQAIGSYEKSVEAYAKSIELAGDSQNAEAIRQSFVREGWEGTVRLLTGIPRPPAMFSYQAATLLASIGEKDAAFAELNTAYENREAFLVMIKVDARMDSLRDDPRFKELLRKMGLPE
jgi:tetratricopeptide (TPR) repeat protein